MGRMPEIHTFLTFEDRALEAAEFYTALIPGSSIERVTHYPDLGAESPRPAGSVMTVEFALDGRRFTALNAGAGFPFGPGISIAVVFDAQSEVDRVWDGLVDAGGTPMACGWITDHFGIAWQINPRRLTELITDPDPDRAARAMRAMMGMAKIDAAAIERAADG